MSSFIKTVLTSQAPSVVESISFSLISLTPVTFDLNCDTTTSMNVSRFNFASQLPQSRYYTIDSVCLNRDVPYQLTVEDTSFTQTGWLVDCVSNIPKFKFCIIFFYHTLSFFCCQTSVLEVPTMPARVHRISRPS